MMLTLLTGNTTVEANQPLLQHILIHMKTSLAQDDAQICAVPNVAWAFVKAGHHVTILVDARAVTSVTKGFGWLRRLMDSDTTALDRAALPEGQRVSLAEQMGCHGFAPSHCQNSRSGEIPTHPQSLG
ncbi:MAG: hypothetical protein WD425_17520 [Nitrospirales bacterium]